MAQKDIFLLILYIVQLASTTIHGGKNDDVIVTPWNSSVNLTCREDEVFNAKIMAASGNCNHDNTTLLGKATCCVSESADFRLKMTINSCKWKKSNCFIPFKGNVRRYMMPPCEGRADYLLTSGIQCIKKSLLHPVCNGSTEPLVTTSGYLHSPGFPGVYKSSDILDLDVCETFLQANESYTGFHLHFKVMDLPGVYGKPCKQDYVDIRDYTAFQRRSVATWCGQSKTETLVEINSTIIGIQMVVQPDKMNDYRTGFLLYFEAIPAKKSVIRNLTTDTYISRGLNIFPTSQDTSLLTRKPENSKEEVKNDKNGIEIVSHPVQQSPSSSPGLWLVISLVFFVIGLVTCSSLSVHWFVHRDKRQMQELTKTKESLLYEDDKQIHKFCDDINCQSLMSSSHTKNSSQNIS